MLCVMTFNSCVHTNSLNGLEFCLPPLNMSAVPVLTFVYESLLVSISVLFSEIIRTCIYMSLCLLQSLFHSLKLYIHVHVYTWISACCNFCSILWECRRNQTGPHPTRTGEMSTMAVILAPTKSTSSSFLSGQCMGEGERERGEGELLLYEGLGVKYT